MSEIGANWHEYEVDCTVMGIDRRTVPTIRLQSSVVDQATWIEIIVRGERAVMTEDQAHALRLALTLCSRSNEGKRGERAQQMVRRIR